MKIVTFLDNRLKISKTYKELLSVSKVLFEKEIITFEVDSQDMWPIMFHYVTPAMRMVGLYTVKAALKGEEAFGQEGFIAVAI